MKRATRGGRYAFPIAVGLAVAGCAGSAPPPVADDAPPPLRSWMPEGAPAAAIVAVHGFNDYSRAFEEFASYAADQGVAVQAFDQRGFGANPDAGFWPGTGVLVEDLRKTLERWRRHQPDVPLVVLGESMGAAVVIVTLARSDPDLVDLTVLSAPAAWGGDQLNPIYRAVLWVMAGVAPGYRLTGEDLGVRPTDNLDILIGMGRDPLVIKATRVDAIAGLVELMDHAVVDVSMLEGPLLVLKGARDEIVPPDSQDAMVARLEATPCTVVTYPDGYHMLLRDLQRERVWRDILTWIETARIPSGFGEPCGPAIREAAAGASRSGS